MIDIEEAERAFKQYLKNYDSEKGEIKLKIRHTYGVVKQSDYLAKRLWLDEKNTNLAKVIALLHDIGRFEQLKLTNSYLDHTGFDHAAYGVKVLFEEGLIRDFVKTSQYDNIIYKAIANHNKYQIEENLNKEELLHAKIIRDADKLDNFRVKTEEKLEDVFACKEETIGYEKITSKVYEDFKKKQQIQSIDRKTGIDMWISFIAFIFDLNFSASLQYLKENNYINRVIDRIEYKEQETKEKMEQIRKEANAYIEKNTPR